MSSSDEMPTLADLRLRRGTAKPAKRKAAKTPEAFGSSLFDTLPVREPLSFLPAAPVLDIEGEIEGGSVVSVTGSARAPIRVPDGVTRPIAASLPVMAVKPTEEPAVWTVPALVRRVRGLVEQSFAAQLTVEGEISNWRPAGSGHCYFTLKGGDAQLSVVMFRAQGMRLKFRPKDGDAVRLRGQLSVYESRGQMQMVAASMELAGLGAQLAAVQELKTRLRAEGLFERKRPLPAFPKCIGVITSLQGAALRDIVKVCRRRHAGVNLLVYPAAVQGPNCAREVVAGLRWFDAHPERVDVLLLARGGGSWEDLHGFDDERVVRAIAACVVPVVVGVGHATDTTIADAAADVCAPTPSAAAELVTAAQHKVEEHVARLRARVTRAGSYELLQARQRLMRLGSEVALRRVREGLAQKVQRVDELGFQLQAAARAAMRGRAERLREAEVRLQARHVGRELPELQRRQEGLRARLDVAAGVLVTRRGARLEAVRSQLGALSPLRVLERGYALVYGEDGSLLRVAEDAREGSVVRARLAQGSLRARVEDVDAG